MKRILTLRIEHVMTDGLRELFLSKGREFLEEWESSEEPLSATKREIAVVFGCDVDEITELTIKHEDISEEGGVDEGDN